MRLSFVSIAPAAAVAGCGSDEASFGSDFDDEMRIHGHDLVYDLGAGEHLHLRFVPPYVSGIFEVQVHTGHTISVEVGVSG